MIERIHSKRRALLATLAAALLFGGGGCGRDEATSSETLPEVSVSVTKAERRELPRSIRVTGTLHGEEETTIAAKVAGRVVEVVRDLGDVAQPGDPLVRIDPTDYDLEKTERERAFLEALARLGLRELPPESYDVNQLPSVERGRLQAENAKARRDRAKVLADRKPPLISEQDFADIATAYEVAMSNLKVERLTAEATLAEARTLDAQVSISEQRVLDTVHRAPAVDAAAVSAAKSAAPATPDEASPRLYEVAERLVTAGDYVQVGAPLLRLVDSDPLKLRVPVTERRLGAVQKGQRVTVSVEAFSGSFDGEVARVSPAVDTATRSFSVEVLVPNRDRILKPGSFATASIQIGTETALVIPATAVLTFAGLSKVVLVRDGKVAEQIIDVGEKTDGMVEVRGGLTTDDIIVATPTAALTTGTAVTISAGEKAEQASTP
jgi:multidrug efflux pump subunit AcrA (membrane-fusion protein)